MKNQIAKVEPKPLELSRVFVNPYGTHVYRFDVGMPSDQFIAKLESDKAAMMSADIIMRRKPFYGTVSGDSFKLTWLQQEMRNSWAPVAVGRIQPMGGRTRVNVAFKQHFTVQFFTIVWMLVAIGILLYLIATGSLDFSKPY